MSYWEIMRSTPTWLNTRFNPLMRVNIFWTATKASLYDRVPSTKILAWYFLSQVNNPRVIGRIITTSTENLQSARSLPPYRSNKIEAWFPLSWSFYFCFWRYTRVDDAVSDPQWRFQDVIISSSEGSFQLSHQPPQICNRCQGITDQYDEGRGTSRAAQQDWRNSGLLRVYQDVRHGLMQM